MDEQREVNTAPQAEQMAVMTQHVQQLANSMAATAQHQAEQMAAMTQQVQVARSNGVSMVVSWMVAHPIYYCAISSDCPPDKLEIMLTEYIGVSHNKQMRLAK